MTLVCQNNNSSFYLHVSNQTELNWTEVLFPTGEKAES